MAIVKSREEDHAIFDCVTQEAERQRVKRPEHADAIDSAAKKIMNLVKDGKLEENLMLVEFTRALQKLWAPRTLHNPVRYASK